MTKLHSSSESSQPLCFSVSLASSTKPPEPIEIVRLQQGPKGKQQRMIHRGNVFFLYYKRRKLNEIMNCLGAFV
jgi:hypothetical protein